MSVPEGGVTNVEVREQVDRLFHAVDDALVNGGLDALDQETVQRIAALGVKLYAAARQQGREFPPFPDSSTVNATEVSIMAMGMLKAVNMDVFELSLWRRWSQL